MLPKLEFEVRRGDIVQFGLSISNSEIGQGALEVAIYALRLICLNGMTMPDNKHARTISAGAWARRTWRRNTSPTTPASWRTGLLP